MNKKSAYRMESFSKSIFTRSITFLEPMDFFYSWFCKVYKNVIIPAINHFYFLNKTCITIFFHLSLALQEQSHSSGCRGDTAVAVREC